jgi:hypothetical protein
VPDTTSLYYFDENPFVLKDRAVPQVSQLGQEHHRISKPDNKLHMNEFIKADKSVSLAQSHVAVLRRKHKLAISLQSNPFLQSDTSSSLDQSHANHKTNLPVSRSSILLPNKTDIEVVSCMTDPPHLPAMSLAQLSSNQFIMHDRLAQARFFREYDDQHKTPPFGKCDSVASLVNEQIEVRWQSEFDGDLAALRRYILDQMQLAVEPNVKILIADTDYAEYVFV